VERPTSGRRHIRAGSITVAELIKNRPTPVRLPARDDDAVTEEMVGVLAEPQPASHQPVSHQDVSPNTHRRAPARTRQAAKIAVLGVAAGVLCVSVAAASIITTHRQTAPEAAAVQPSVPMTDEQVLLPNLFTLGPAAAQRRTDNGLPLPTKGAPTTVDAPPAAHAPENKAVPSHPVPAEDPIDAELVRRYYDLLANQPTQALGLLDGVLRASDLSHFVTSWSQVRDIHVLDVQQRSDGTLLAVVAMVLPDGGTARVQQLLTVTKTVPQRITGAEILSAQRS
jgi:hypothetical protein